MKIVMPADMQSVAKAMVAETQLSERTGVCRKVDACSLALEKTAITYCGGIKMAMIERSLKTMCQKLCAFMSFQTEPRYAKWKLRGISPGRLSFRE